MRRILATALLLASLLGAAAPAWAWTATYSWSPATGATSYKVEKTVDQGATWTLVASPTAPTYAYTGTEPGLVLFRISACNAVACTPRWADFLAHDESKQPPPAAMNLGVQ